MAFVSKAQQRFMFAKHPRMAREFAAKTPNMAALPEHKGIADSSRKHMMMRAEATRRGTRK